MTPILLSQTAKEHQENFLKELIQKKKLYLILDLDQTILHAAPCDSKEAKTDELGYFWYFDHPL